MGEMIPRTRVLKTVNHQQPDRIPLDLGSTLVTGITKNAYLKLVNLLGFKIKSVELYDTIQQLAVVQEQVLQKLQVDVRGLIPNFVRKKPSLEKQDDSYCFIDEWGISWKISPSQLYFSIAKSPLSGSITKADIKNFPWPEPDAPDIFEGLEKKARQYYENGYAVILESVCAGIFEMACRLRGTEQLYVDMVNDTDIVCELMDKLVEIKIKYYQAAERKLGKYIQFIKEADDMAGQKNLLISPQTYRQIIKPRHKQLFDAQRKIFSQPFHTFLHSDGAILEIIPDFIEIGIEILNPLQLTADGMDAGKIKKEFGKDLTFWGGGINTQQILPLGSETDVEKNVTDRIKSLAPGGGFIFGTVHNIQDDVPPQNIIAMFDTFRKLRDY